MIEPGRTGAYFALFSEIGIVLLITTLGGSLAGHWVDEQLGLGAPLFLLGGLLGGLAAVWWHGLLPVLTATVTVTVPRRCPDQRACQSIEPPGSAPR